MAAFSDCKVFFDTFSHEAGISCTFDEHLPQGTLTVENFNLLFCFLENSGELLLQAGVGLPCSDDALPEEQIKFWKDLAKANNLFAGAVGGALGYDPEADLVTLQMAAPLEGMTQESFEKLVQTMFMQCATWMQRLAGPDAGVAEEGQQESKKDLPARSKDAPASVTMA